MIVFGCTIGYSGKENTWKLVYYTQAAKIGFCKNIWFKLEIFLIKEFLESRIRKMQD